MRHCGIPVNRLRGNSWMRSREDLVSVTPVDRLGGNYFSANLTGLVLGCIEAKFCKKKMRLKALAEIYTMHSFAQLCNLNVRQNFAEFKKFLI